MKVSGFPVSLKTISSAKGSGRISLNLDTHWQASLHDAGDHLISSCNIMIMNCCNLLVIILSPVQLVPWLPWADRELSGGPHHPKRKSAGKGCPGQAYVGQARQPVRHQSVMKMYLIKQRATEVTHDSDYVT